MPRATETVQSSVLSTPPSAYPAAEHGSANHSYSHPSLDLRIDELVLHGFPTSQRAAIGKAVQMELERLFAQPGATEGFLAGTPAVSAALARLDGGAFQFPAGSPPEIIGRHIAASLYAVLERWNK